jgi:hypothetical protein
VVVGQNREGSISRNKVRNKEQGTRKQGTRNKVRNKGQGNKEQKEQGT